MFGVGKTMTLKTYKNSPEFHDILHIVFQHECFEEVLLAGERMLVLLYNGSTNQSLDEL